MSKREFYNTLHYTEGMVYGIGSGYLVTDMSVAPEHYASPALTAYLALFTIILWCVVVLLGDRAYCR